MKRISVTHLETFRRFRDGATEYDTEQNVIEAITGTFTGNNYTRIGTEAHSIIENAKNGLVLPKNGVVFSEQQKQIFVNHAEILYPFVAEVKSTKQFASPIGLVVISCIADVLKANTIRDNKVRFKPTIFFEYLQSCQWRFYLSIFGLERFYYDVFEFVGYKGGLDVSGLELIAHEPFECVSYATMEADLQSIIDDFIEWAQFRNLLKYIKEQ